MFKLVFYCISVCLIIICGSASIIANPGDWINHVGPWVMPHIYNGDPAIGYIPGGTQVIYDACSEGIDPDGAAPVQYGTFRSRDFGESWDLVDVINIPREVVCIEEDADIAWSCGHFEESIRRTTDGGDSWETKADGISNYHIQCIDVQQSSYSLGLENTILYAGTYDAIDLHAHTVYYSVNGGDNWTEASLPYDDEPRFMLNIEDIDIFELGDGGTAVLSSSYIGHNPDAVILRGLYITYNFGIDNDWAQISPPYQTKCVAFSPYSSEIIYTGTYGRGIMRTLNGGGDWEQLTGNLIANSIKVINSSEDPGNDTIIVATEYTEGLGIYYSTDGGQNWASWNRNNHLCDVHVRGIYIDPIDHNKLIAATESRFYVTAIDDWENVEWVDKTADLWNIHMGEISVVLPNIAVGPWDNDHQNDYQTAAGMYNSTNGGQDWNFMWSFVDGITFFRDLKLNPFFPEILYSSHYHFDYLGTEEWYWDITETPCPFFDAMSPLVDAVECIAAGDRDGDENYVYWAGRGAEFEGSNFSRLLPGGEYEEATIAYIRNYVYDIDVIPTNYPELLLAATESGIYRSLDRGADGSWAQINQGILGQANTIELADRNFEADDFKVAYVGTVNTVYRCLNILDEEPYWEFSDYGIHNTPGYLDSIVALVVHPADNSVLYTVAKKSQRERGGDLYRVYVSADSARSWIDITRNLPYGCYSFHDLDIHPLNHKEPETFSTQLGKMDTTYAASNYGLYKYYENIWPDQAVNIYEEIYHEPMLPENQITTWGPGLEIVHGDVIIPKNSTLNIVSPCTVLVVYDFDVTESGDDVGKAEIIIEGGGELIANGFFDSPIVFMSSNPGNPLPGDWKGIVVKEDAYLNLSYCTIEHATSAIEAYNNSIVNLDNCLIENSSEFGVTCIHSAIVLITNSTFINNNIYAITAIDVDEEAVFTGNTISGNHLYGIRYFGSGLFSATAIINSSIISTTNPSSGYGIHIEGDIPVHEPRAIISDVEISNFCCGMALFDSDNETIIGPGVECFNNHYYGLILERGTAAIMGENDGPNVFSNNFEGITGCDNHGKVRKTLIENNQWGAELINSTLDFGSIASEGENSFAGNNDWFLANYDGPIMYAQLNWWGTTDLNEIREKVTENIIFEPIRPVPLPFGKILMDFENLPTEFELIRAYPNPFNASTSIEFAIPEIASVSISVYNILGQEIRNLYNQDTQPGIHTVIWDGRNNNSDVVSSGVYLYSLKTPEKVLTKKLVLLK